MKRLFCSFLGFFGLFPLLWAQYHSAPNFEFTAQKENLGQVVNTSFTETKPVVSGDGKVLYFCRQNYPGNIRGKQDDQDIYVATYKQGQWTDVQNIGWPLNDQHPNGISSVSPDGNSLLLINEYIKGGYVKKGVSISHRGANGWSYPTKIEIEDFYNFSPYVDYALSPNGKVLFMSVQRRDSHGDQDIYVSLLENGKWSSPINLGPTVNTAGADFAPFLAADGKTLYFASEGHPGYGGSDIFYCKRLGSGWTEWSEPINLGTAVNGNTWDAYYSMPANGSYAYFVSKNLQNNSRDLYRIALPDAIKPEPVVMIKGKVMDATTLQPMEATISIECSESNQEQGVARSNPVNGSFKIVLPHGRKYRFHAKNQEYISLHNTLDLTGAKEYSEINENLFLVPLKPGEKIPIKDIFFVRSKAQLLPESYSKLDVLVSILKNHPTLVLELGGHTDNIGEPELNMQLSWERVARVKQYLVGKGINQERLLTKGYGGTQPISDHNGELYRRLNRRVEFTILQL